MKQIVAGAVCGLLIAFAVWLERETRPFRPPAAVS